MENWVRSIHGYRLLEIYIREYPNHPLQDYDKRLEYSRYIAASFVTAYRKKHPEENPKESYVGVSRNKANQYNYQRLASQTFLKPELKGDPFFHHIADNEFDAASCEVMVAYAMKELGFNLQNDMTALGPDGIIGKHGYVYLKT